MHCIGVGNSIRQDDAAGLVVASSLRRVVRRGLSSGFVVHPPSMNPESQISKAALNGDRLVLFDAVEANLPAGEIVAASLAETKFGFFATHNIPLKLVPEVSNRLEDVMIVGVQPDRMDVGEGLSPVVQQACNRIVKEVSVMIGDGVNGHG